MGVCGDLKNVACIDRKGQVYKVCLCVRCGCDMYDWVMLFVQLGYSLT